jgi:hypothetical protein
VTKRRPELVVQSLAAINVRWSFPAAGSPIDCGVSYAGGSTVVRIFGPGPRNCNGTSGRRGMPNVIRWCCGGGFLEREWLRDCDVRSDATWCVSFSMLSSNSAVLSDVPSEMLAVVHWLVTSQFLSSIWEVKSRLPSVWPACIVCTCGGRRLVQMVRRK